MIGPRIWYKDSDDNWVTATPDANGNTDNLYLINLIQVLRLNVGESPFYANYGIPAQRAVIQQIFPDFYVNQTQSQFAPYFASMQITKRATEEPVYDVAITANDGRKFLLSIPA